MKQHEIMWEFGKRECKSVCDCDCDCDVSYLITNCGVRMPESVYDYTNNDDIIGQIVFFRKLYVMFVNKDALNQIKYDPGTVLK